MSFLRDKMNHRGGPDGGWGGDGGHVYIEASSELATLQHLSGVGKISAQPGLVGQKRNKKGKDGDDVTIRVPIGTMVWINAQNRAAIDRAQKFGMSTVPRDKQHLQQYFLIKPMAPPWPEDTQTRKELVPVDAALAQEFGQKYVELKEDGQRVLLCQGGYGGRGNAAFKAPDNQTPMTAQWGGPGEIKQVGLELKLLADIGLVGYPSVGKSTLLSSLTQARPKIASYPFTTLEPMLGVLRYDNKEWIVADIPGIIEGAHLGKGLGLQFLRHLERCQSLCFVVSPEEAEILVQKNGENSDEDEHFWAQRAEVLAKQIIDQLKMLQNELSFHNASLLAKPSLIVISKADLYPDRLKAKIIDLLQHKNIPALFISAPLHEGTDLLVQNLVKITASRS